MIATVDISIQAANPSLPLFPMRAFEGSPSSIRIRNVPKRIGDWVIDKVYFAVTYPDNSTQTIECKLVGGVYVGTVSGCSAIGSVKNGYSIFADGKDENGNAITNYCLGKGDVQILDARGITQPLQNATFVQILSARPASPNDGDMWYENDAWYVWQNGQAWAVGDDSGLIDELNERVDALDSTTSELSSDVANLKDGMQSVEERLGVVDSTISGLNGAIDVVDVKVDAIERDAEVMAERIGEIDSSLNNYELKSDLSGDVSNIVTETEDVFSEWTFNQAGNYSIVEWLDTTGDSPLWMYRLMEDGEVVSQQHSEERALSLDWDMARPYLVSTRQKIGEKNKLGLALESELSDGSFIVKKADGSTSSEKLVNSLSDEHSTRIIVDEHDTAIVQKYVQSGWYVENVKVRVGTTGDYVDTTDYWVTVNVETTADGLVFNWTFQDYARTLITKHRSYTKSDTSITTSTFSDSWYASETGGQIISLQMHCVYSATPIWVNVSRLVPDGSTQSGLRDTQITPDGTFVTPDQVEPLGWLHYAKGARDAMYMYQPNALGTGLNKTKWVQIHPTEGKLTMANTTYPSWFLSKYNGTTIDPPIEMKWGYYTTTTYYMRSIRTIQINSWAWVATSLYPQTGTTRNRFYIKANADDDGNIESIDDKFYVSTTAHDITFSSNNLSVETFDGNADLVECTRASDIRTEQLKYFVLEEDLSAGLSAKADVSSLNDYELKADLSSDVSAIVTATSPVAEFTFAFVSGNPVDISLYRAEKVDASDEPRYNIYYGNSLAIQGVLLDDGMSYPYQLQDDLNGCIIDVTKTTENRNVFGFASYDWVKNYIDQYMQEHQS